MRGQTVVVVGQVATSGTSPLTLRAEVCTLPERVRATSVQAGSSAGN